jgi:ankyrin repeat protein
MPIEAARQEEIRRIGEAVGTAGLTGAMGMENVNAQILIDCLKAGVLIDPELFFGQELNVNWRDAETGGTLLHIAAAYGIRPVLRLLLRREDTDYLARDDQGRLASMLA